MLALLMASGVILTILCITDELALWPSALLVAGGSVAVMSLSVLHPRGRLVALTGLGAAAGIWLLLGGWMDLVEVIRALTLYASGLTTALPLVQGSYALVLGFLMGLAAYGLTSFRVGAQASATLVAILAMTLWAIGRQDAAWTLFPALMACVTLVLMSGNENSVRFSRVLAMVLAVVLLSFTGVAIGGITIEPMKEATSAIRQKIYDYLFFTSPRDVFSIASQGYYPQGRTQLGGPAEPNDQPVLRVEGSGRIYLRAVGKTTYTGSMWVDETGGRRYLWSSLRWQDMRRSVFDQERPAENDAASLETKRVTVTMLADSASSLFVPQRLRSLQTDTSIVAYFNAGGEVFATRNLEVGDCWTAEYLELTAGQEGLETLINEAAQQTDEQYAEMVKQYTVLPSHLEQRLFNLAREAAGDAQTPYEQALNIQSYLRQHFRYRLDVPEQAANMDFVSTFLLLTQEGYCTHFATAMTVLCRMVGIPARYVEGFVADVGDSGQAIVTGNSAHAWTEVYLNGIGWVTFDATPWTTTQQAGAASSSPEELPTPSASPSETPSPTPSPSPSPTPSPETGGEADEPTPTMQPTDTPAPSDAPTETPTPRSSDEEEDPPSHWWLWLLLILLAVVARIVWTLPQVQAMREKDETARCLIWMQAVHDVLLVMNIRRRMDETPLAFLNRAAQMDGVPDSLALVGKIETLAFYAHRTMRPGDTAAVRQRYETLNRALSPVKKLRLLLLRAFWPLKKRDFTKESA